MRAEEEIKDMLKDQKRAIDLIYELSDLIEVDADFKVSALANAQNKIDVLNWVLGDAESL